MDDTSCMLGPGHRTSDAGKLRPIDLDYAIYGNRYAEPNLNILRCHICRMLQDEGDIFLRRSHMNAWRQPRLRKKRTLVEHKHNGKYAMGH